MVQKGRERNVLDQKCHGAKRPGPKRPDAKRPGPKSLGAKRPGRETSRSKSQGAKRPGPKRLSPESPGAKTLPEPLLHDCETSCMIVIFPEASLCL